MQHRVYEVRQLGINRLAASDEGVVGQLVTSPGKNCSEVGYRAALNFHSSGEVSRREPSRLSSFSSWAPVVERAAIILGMWMEREENGKKKQRIMRRRKATKEKK